MKKFTYFVVTLIASANLSVTAAPIHKSQQADILCELFSIGCPIVTKDGNGDGKEPPRRRSNAASI